MANYIAFQTLALREIQRFLRIWKQTLVPPIITMFLYFVIFGELIGARIGEMHGVGYMQFIAPGLIMMSAITNSFANVAASFHLSKFVRNIDDLLLAPISAHTLIWGYLAGGITRGVLCALLVTGVSLFFVDFKVHSWGVVLLMLLMTTVTFALSGLINGIFARSFDDISIVPTFVLTPLTYLGGVFYSIQLLPAFWQQVSRFNPVMYMINGFRYGFLGVSDVALHYAFGVLLAFVVGLYAIAYTLIVKGVGLRS